jgi:hypothetical protein
MERARRRDALTGYVERHHIVPKCFRSGNRETVDLTPEEHFVAHLLLLKMHPGDRRMVHAAMCMTFASGHMPGRQNKRYGWLRRRYAETMQGRKFSEDHKARIGAALRGKPKSMAHRAALAAAKRGTKRGPHSDEVRARIRESNRATHLRRDKSVYRTPEYRAKQSLAMTAVWASRHQKDT